MHAVQVTVRERPIDGLLPALLKNARERFLENTQPIIKFLCGETACADIVLADKDMLRLLIGNGSDTTLPAAASHAAAASGGGNDGFAAVVGGGGSPTIRPSDVARLRMEWRVSMSELNEKFAVWWSSNGLGNAKMARAPPITSKEAYKIAEQHLGVKVERDTRARIDYMYGVKLLSSMASASGNQAITYG